MRILRRDLAHPPRSAVGFVTQIAWLAAGPRLRTAARPGATSITGASLPNASWCVPSAARQRSSARLPYDAVSRKIVDRAAGSTSAPLASRRSSWNGAPPARIEKTTRSAGQRFGPGGEPGGVARLHLRRVLDARRPPGRRVCRQLRRPGVDEEDLPQPLELREHGADALELAELRGGDAGAREAVERPAHRQCAHAAPRLVDDLGDPFVIGLPERLRLVVRQTLDPERRLAGDDGEVDARAVEAGEAGLEPELVGVDVEGPLGIEHELPLPQQRRSVPGREGLDELPRPEVLMEVAARHAARAYSARRALHIAFAP